MSSRDMRELAQVIARLERQVRQLKAGPRLPWSSIEDGGINEYDAEGVLGSRIGKQFDGTHLGVSLNGPKPPQPSTPVATAIPGGVSVRWDGLFFSRHDISPLDFSRVEVHVDSDPDFEPVFATTLRDTIESPRGGDVIAWIPEADGLTSFYVKFVVRTQSGNSSDSSLVSDGVVPPVGDPGAGLEGRVDALEAAVGGLATDKADLDSPEFVGTPILPTTASPGDVWTSQSTDGTGAWAAPSGGGGGGFTTEQVQDIVGALIVAGTGVSVVYDDLGAAITITATGTTLTTEDVQDIVGAQITAGTGISVAYDDAGTGAITITATGGGVTDGDKGDIVVSSSGSVWSIDSSVLTTAGRTLIAAANASAQRAALGVAIGSDVQAWDADLDALAAVTGNDVMTYRNGSGAWTAVSLTAAGRAILDDATAADQRTTLGIDDAADVRIQAAEEPLDQGLLAVSFDAGYGAVSQPTAGSLYLAKIFLASPKTITNLHIQIETAGSVLTVSQCFAALYDSAGTRQGVTASQHLLWQSTGAKTMALTGSYAAPRGFYWVALVANGTTMPQILRSVAATNSQRVNAFLSAATSRAGIAATGQTTAPSSFTPSSINQTAHHFWVGVS